MTARAVASGVARFLPIGGREIPLTEELLPLEDVRLDPDNPRLRHRIRSKFKGKTPTQEQIRDIVLELNGVSELQSDIRVAGGLTDPIYITADGLVVEGNCRTAVYLRLKNAAALKGEARWKKIRVYRFPRSVTQNEIAIFQAKCHITSQKKEWDAYEKANHIFHMHTELGMSVEEISKSLEPRMQKETVETHLKTYAHYTEGFLKKAVGKGPAGKTRKRPTAGSRATPSRKGAPEGRSTSGSESKEAGLRNYSYYVEFNKRGDLADFRASPANCKRFNKLVESGKLGHAMNVRKLRSIIDVPGALEVLEKKGIDEALKVVAMVDPTAGSPLFKILKEAVDALGKFPKSEIAGIREQKKQQQLIRSLHSKLCGLAEMVGMKLEG